MTVVKNRGIVRLERRGNQGRGRRQERRELAAIERCTSGRTGSCGVLASLRSSSSGTSSSSGSSNDRVIKNSRSRLPSCARFFQVADGTGLCSRVAYPRPPRSRVCTRRFLTALVLLPGDEPRGLGAPFAHRVHTWRPAQQVRIETVVVQVPLPAQALAVAASHALL